MPPDLVTQLLLNGFPIKGFLAPSSDDSIHIVRCNLCASNIQYRKHLRLFRSDAFWNWVLSCSSVVIEEPNFQEVKPTWTRILTLPLSHWTPQMYSIRPGNRVSCGDQDAFMPVHGTREPSGMILSRQSKDLILTFGSIPFPRCSTAAELSDISNFRHNILPLIEQTRSNRMVSTNSESRRPRDWLEWLDLYALDNPVHMDAYHQALKSKRTDANIISNGRCWSSSLKQMRPALRPDPRTFSWNLWFEDYVLKIWNNPAISYLKRCVDSGTGVIMIRNT